MDLRTLLAAVLGVGLGAVFLVSPEFVVQVQTAWRLPPDRGGDYGSETQPANWLGTGVRVVGALLVAGGLYFAWTLV